jgi:PPE-repeat protein
MAFYSASFQGAAGSATLPFAGLRSGTAANQPVIREIKVFTTAANAARIRIVRITTAGTATSITTNPMGANTTPASATGVHTYTSTAPTITAGDIDIGAVGAAIGSGFVFTYYGEGLGLWIPGAATNATGIALIEVADTANTYDGTFLWEE